jgi:hypothetical protein
MMCTSAFDLYWLKLFTTILFAWMTVQRVVVARVDGANGKVVPCPVRVAELFILHLALQLYSLLVGTMRILQ